MPMPTSKREYDSLMSSLQNQASSGGVNAELAKSQMAMLSGSKYANPAKKFAKGGKVDKAAQKKVGKVMHEFKTGTLHSGKNGPVVKSRKQAIAIAMSEAGMKKPIKKAGGGMIKAQRLTRDVPRMGTKGAVTGASGIKKYAAGGSVTPGKPPHPLSRSPRGAGPNDAGGLLPRPRPVGAVSGVKKFAKGGMAKKGCK